MDREIEYHLERLAQDYIAQGMEPAEARRRARLEFGGPAQIQEDLRDVHRARWLADLRMDLVYAARTLRRSPGFLASATLTLALGIGANTAIFSLIDAVMLRPLPVPDPSALVQIARVVEGDSRSVSYPLFQYLRDRMSSTSGVFVALDLVNTITLDGVDEEIYGDAVSGDYYRVLGLTPAAGRLLNPGDDAAAAPVAMISYAYWKRRFAFNPSAIGKTFRIGATELTVVGVEPPDFVGTARGFPRDFTTPLMTSERIGPSTDAWRREWTFNFLPMMGRLKPGVTLERANAEMYALYDSWRRDKAEAIPRAPDRNRFLKERVAILPAAAGLNGLRYRFFEPLAILMFIVGLVLLLACANLSGLLLARASSRQREIAVRRALGAGNGRLARQLLAESLLLACLGAGLGFTLAQWFSRTLVAMMANGDRLNLPIDPDWRVLAFTISVSLAACLLAGLTPALNAGRGGVNPALKEVRSSRNRVLGRALVMAQLAISMALLVGASLFIRTLVKLYTVDTGVQTGGVFTFGVAAKHHFPSERSGAIEASIVKRLRSLPGVLAATAASRLPLDGGLWTQNVRVEGYAFGPGEDDKAAFNSVAPGFFAVTGTPVLAGRDFNDRDSAASTPVALVNNAFARRFFGSQAALGRHVTANGISYEIVGVVQDSKYNLREGVTQAVYISWTQQGNVRDSNRSQPMGFTYLARAASGDPLSLAPAMERAVPELDPALRLRTPRTLAEIVDESTLNERMMAALGGFFGLLALIVACLGIFGLLAFQVSRRINELGVRMALGASRGNIVGLVLREVEMMLVPGCVAGGVLALGLTRFAKNMLFGVTPTDPAAFALSVAALSIATFAAGFVPALRASRIDPMSALRHE
jgi:putative ABC transport system permease protein